MVRLNLRIGKDRKVDRTEEALRERIQRESRALAADAAVGTPIDPARLAAVESGHRLLTILGASEAPKERSRWLVIILFVLAAAGAAVFAGTRMPAAPFVLTARATHVQIRTSGTGTLFEDLPIDRLGMGQIERVDLPRVARRPDRAQRDSKGRPLTLVLEALAGNASSLVLGTTMLMPNAKLSLSGGRDVVLIIVPPSEPVSVTLGGRLALHMDGYPDAPFDLQPRDRATVDFGGAVDLSFHLARATGCVICRPIRLGTIAFEDEDLVSKGGHTQVRRVSGIIGGELRIGDRQQLRQLEAGEDLELGLADAELRILRVDSGGEISVEVTGQASSILVGTSRSNLIPTWFQWITSRHWAVTWSLALAAFGVLLRLARFLGAQV